MTTYRPVIGLLSMASGKEVGQEDEVRREDCHRGSGRVSGAKPGTQSSQQRYSLPMDEEERSRILRMLGEAVESLCQGMDPRLVPEVGTNIVFASAEARDPSGVAAVDGRIVRVGGLPRPAGGIAFGASSHVARVVLTAMRFDRDIRSAANIRFCEEAIHVAEDALFEVCSFDRQREPPGVRTMDWGVAFCCEDGVPDIIYDRGAVGKEAMIRVLAPTPQEVATKINIMSRRIH